MRLIDADKLIEAIENHDFGTIKAYGEHSQVAKILANVFIFAVEEVVKIVKTQPTAYDVDKVVEEIEEYTCKECKETGTDKRFYYGMGCKACAYGKILQIVKRGGLNG